jgi:hypothetical protein
MERNDGRYRCDKAALKPMEKMMTSNTDKFTHVSFTDGRELTQDELEAASGGTPAKNPHPRTDYLKIELKEVSIANVSF